MSHTAQIRSHRKPRRNTSKVAMRAGVASGVFGTLAVAGASASSAHAAEPVTQTIELPTLTADLAAQVAQSADITQQAAANYQLQAERDAAAAKAAKQAKADLAEAKKKAAEEARKKAAEEARRKAAERASRTAERTTLATTAGTTAVTSTSTSTATGSAAAVVAFVKAQVGKAYVSGATGPSAYDCSGLVQAAFKQVGINLPRVSQSQSTVGTQVSLSNLKPGDILYWGSPGSAYHVGVYVGNGMFVGAQNPSTGVVERPLSYDPPSGAVRVL
ncbi:MULTISPECIES: C40 family peptidase [Streptomyces]|jgi:cell wall-associated NlpC family hydrolase|uniref:C40 family peptidase n=1 Tax=Streptomyces TaxID=1883 RepID=UPI000A3B09CF|nr:MULTISPECIES: C40 family peptidase [Streptomyces]MDN5380609.1 C40 family peptidase [Streptomyces sp. LB8]